MTTPEQPAAEPAMQQDLSGEFPPQADGAREQSLAMMIRMLAYALKRRDGSNTLPTRAMDLLGRYGLQGCILRAESEPAADYMPRDEQRIRLALARKPTPGRWDVDTIDNEGEYGGGGPDTHSGYKSHSVFNEAGHALFDTLNRDAALVEVVEEYDEDSFAAWDDLGSRDCEFIAACNPVAIASLLAELDRLRADRALRASAPAVLPGWPEAYAAFQGAFDTPLARRKDNSDFAQDARRRLREFNEAMLAAAPNPPTGTASIASAETDLRFIQERIDYWRSVLQEFTKAHGADAMIENVSSILGHRDGNQRLGDTGTAAAVAQGDAK
jgi:hypothetical protein